MKSVLRACLPLLALSLSSLLLRAQSAPAKQLVVALSAPDKPGFLQVNQVAGAIHIVGYAGKTVVVEATVPPLAARRRPAGTPASSGLRRVDSGPGFEVTAAETNNHVTITTDSWRRAIDLTIKVPRQFSLQLSTTQQGDIVVENVAGEFEISNVNGSIRLQQVAGSALLNSINGRLTASFTAVTPRAPMSFSTANGQIDLTLPVAVKATLKLKSDRGAVYSDFDLAVDPAAPTQVGPQRLSQDGWTVGRLNGGGADITVQSLEGTIVVRKAR